MLNDERIREIALTAVPPCQWTARVDEAIRIAVREAFGECARECDWLAEKLDAFSSRPVAHKETARMLAAVFREKARAA